MQYTNQKTSVTMRFDCPVELNKELHKLAAEIGMPVKDLLLDAIALLMLHNNSGHGLKTPPVRLT
jgi:hypothetical protein